LVQWLITLIEPPPPHFSNYKFNPASITIIVENDLLTKNYFLHLVTTWVNEHKSNLKLQKLQKLQLKIVVMCWLKFTILVENDLDYNW
jgi:hypothetical protein